MEILTDVRQYCAFTNILGGEQGGIPFPPMEIYQCLHCCLDYYDSTTISLHPFHGTSK